MSSRRAAAATLCVFALWLLGILPTIYWADSGELTLGGFLLGLSHAPSFPVYAMLLKAVSFLPMGDLAFKASLASVIFGALAAGGLFWIFHRLLERTPGGVGGPVRFVPLGAAVALCLFVVSPQVWTVAVRQEVYTLNLAVTVVLLASILTWARDREPRWLFVAGFTFGLGLGNHSLLIVATFPAVALFLFWTDWKATLSPRTLAFTVAAFLLGLSSYLYLPLRSALDPMLDWNDPEHWQGFVDSFTKRRETGLFVAKASLGTNLRTFTGALVEAFTPWLVGLAALGLMPILRRDRKAAGLLLGLAGLSVAVVVMAPTYDWDNPDSPGYLLIAYAVYALLIGEAVRRMAQGAAARLGPRGGVTMAGLLGVAAAGVAWGAAPARIPAWDDDRARLYGLMHLEAAPAGASILTKSDPATFLPWYLQAVEGRRPDVRVINRKGLATLHVRAQLDRRFPGLINGPAIPLERPPLRQLRMWSIEAPDPADNTAQIGAEVKQFLEVNLGRHPVLWEGGSDHAWVLELSRPRGPLFEIFRTPVTLSEADHRVNLEYIRRFLTRMDPPGQGMDPRAGRAMEVVVYNLANALRREVPAPRGRIAAAFGALWRSRPAQLGAGANYAFELFAAGEFGRAEAVYRTLIDQAPDQPRLWSNLGAAVARQGRLTEAGAIFKAGLEHHPGDAELRASLKRVEEAMGGTGSNRGAP